MHRRSSLRRRRLAGVLATLSVLASGGSRADGLSAQPAPGDTAAAPSTAASVVVDNPFAQQAPPPLGIYGVNLPEKSRLVVFALPSFANLSGPMIGAQSVTPQYAVTHVYTTYSPAGVGVPHLVRNDPADVRHWAEAFGATYGVTDNIAVTVASSYKQNEQTILVYKGMTGSTLIGTTSPHVEGFGDTSLVGAWRVYQDAMNQVNVSMGVSLPTGSITANMTLMNNSGVVGTHRAVYALQTGDGTYDALPGIVYSGVLGPWSWGASYRGRLPLDVNDQGYRWGSYNEGDIWGGYSWLPGLETSLRFLGSVQGHILGYDPQALGYGPAANPLWYGGEHVDVIPGLNVSGRYFGLPAATVQRDNYDGRLSTIRLAKIGCRRVAARTVSV